MDIDLKSHLNIKKLAQELEFRNDMDLLDRLFDENIVSQDDYREAIKNFAFRRQLLPLE